MQIDEICALLAAEAAYVDYDDDEHVYSCGDLEYPSVSRVMSGVGITSTDWIPEWALERGSIVHDLVSEDPSFARLIASEEHVPYVDRYEEFLDRTGFVPVAREQLVRIPLRLVNPLTMEWETYYICGTLDVIGVFERAIEVKRYRRESVHIPPGTVGVGDYKCGGTYPATMYQVSSYRHGVRSVSGYQQPIVAFGAGLVPDEEFKPDSDKHFRVCVDELQATALVHSMVGAYLMGRRGSFYKRDKR
jgi:hypothetical protein